MKLTEPDLADLADAFCDLAGLPCLAPLHTAQMLQWVEAGIPRRAVDQGFFDFRKLVVAKGRDWKSGGAFELFERKVMLAVEELMDAGRGEHDV